jgi:hypothetical protein
MKRVIVVAGEQIAMEPTLAESLAIIFGAEVPLIEIVAEPPAKSESEELPTGGIANLIDQAQLHYDQALQYQKDGDWANYGKELSALEAVLVQLVELTAEEK